MNVCICPACGYPTLTVGICAACLPVAVTPAVPAAAGQLAAVVGLGVKAG